MSRIVSSSRAKKFGKIGIAKATTVRVETGGVAALIDIKLSSAAISFGVQFSSSGYVIANYTNDRIHALEQTEHTHNNKTILDNTNASFTSVLKSKLDNIENSATADQTATEIKSLYESNADTNNFNNTDKNKLDSIENNATADQTAVEIKSLYESNTNTNNFNDVDKSKLDRITVTQDVSLDVTLGNTTSRPTNAVIGTMYFDSTLSIAGKPIWYTGVDWVDATGTIV